ncbi:hypothetical protein WHZ77_26255 [Bradyrhizobium sp. A5]
MKDKRQEVKAKHFLWAAGGEIGRETAKFETKWSRLIGMGA